MRAEDRLGRVISGDVGACNPDRPRELAVATAVAMAGARPSVVDVAQLAGIVPEIRETVAFQLALTRWDHWSDTSRLAGIPSRRFSEWHALLWMVLQWRG